MRWSQIYHGSTSPPVATWEFWATVILGLLQP